MSPTHKLVIKETGEVLVPRLFRAVTPWERARGLLGRRGLAPDEGLLIERCASIHTLFMRFTIDVAYLDADWRVVKKAPGVVPWRFSGSWGARHTLELPAGALAAAELPLGRHLELREGH